MKNKIICIMLLGILIGCQKPNNEINYILENVQKGAVLRTISSDGEYNFYAPVTSIFKLTIEEHDIDNGALMQNVEVYLSHNGNSEVLHPGCVAAAFGPAGCTKAAGNPQDCGSQYPQCLP